MIFTALLGCTIYKEFYVSGNTGEKRYYRGKIVGFKKARTTDGTLTNIINFRVRYQDGDSEDLLMDEVQELLLLAKLLNIKDKICNDLAERAHCWYFTYHNTREGLDHVKYALQHVRYGAYHVDPHKSLIKGFVYSADVASRTKMLGVLEHANWKPICGQLHHNAAYTEMKLLGLLVETGHPPVKRPTLAEFNNAVTTLDGPWWI
jgi:hypothetical protein